MSIHVYGLTLTMKEEIFCKEYSVDFNAKRAALAAGYAKNRAAQTGYDLLQKPKIQQRLEKVKENLAEEAGISALMVLMELKKIAFSSTGDYFDDWMKIKDFEKIPDDQKAALADIKVTKKTFGKVTEEFVQFKMHDKQGKPPPNWSVSGKYVRTKFPQSQPQQYKVTNTLILIPIYKNNIKFRCMCVYRWPCG